MPDTLTSLFDRIQADIAKLDEREAESERRKAEQEAIDALLREAAELTKLQELCQEVTEHFSSIFDTPVDVEYLGNHRDFGFTKGHGPSESAVFRVDNLLVERRTVWNEGTHIGFLLMGYIPQEEKFTDFVWIEHGVDGETQEQTWKHNGITNWYEYIVFLIRRVLKSAPDVIFEASAALAEFEKLQQAKKTA